MALMENFIIPTLKVSFYIGIFGGLTFFISKALVKRWIKTWKYTFKYKILRKQMSEKTVMWCINAIENRSWMYFKAKQYLYLHDVSQQTVDETMYIFKQVEKELLKGGATNGRNIRPNDSKVKSTESLPEV